MLVDEWFVLNINYHCQAERSRSQTERSRIQADKKSFLYNA